MNKGVGWPIPSPGDLPDPGLEPGSPTFQEDSLPAELPGKTPLPTHPPPPWRRDAEK